MAEEISLYAITLGGLILLALASDSLVRGAMSFSRRLGLSPLLAGIFVVGFGTSLPELTISVSAALEGQPGIALGNLVGSNIANIWLVLALPALLFSISTGHFGQRRSMLVLLAATAAWIGLAAFDQFTPLAGMVLLAVFVLYAITVAWQTHGAYTAGTDVGFTQREKQPDTLFMTFAMITCGVIGLPIAAYLIVDGGVGLARAYDLPEEYIGLTLLAVGTSLPELGVSLIAALRRQGDVVIGNVLGSNLFNLLGIGGLIALFGQLDFAPVFKNYDHWILGAATLTLAVFILPKGKVSRLAGLALLLAYAVYLYGLVNGWNILAQVKALS
ncbi:calcium/sodium antiporter [Hyphomonas sp. FCG-A18]|uniref:calcium/sodium antiporter n=1 Tax=Hyphomonas sp. FCG-A18 TaxID=3080019 RepID=UPI002B2F820B|nr:calcium/sodium antiporter [Hyphomonas sp. FCG-A18]